MAKKTVYDLIKKQNGEEFAQTIRAFDSGIFDVENLPHILKYAGTYAEPLLDFLSMLKNVQITPQEKVENPFELLKKAGYDAYLVTNKAEQNSIRKYFTPEAQLCTFSDSERYNDYFIIHCVKEGAELLNQSDFISPSREDEYATSVISIQINKRGGHIKITNRYNHLVENPDNTFNSNPDKIINGLSWALMHYFKIDFSASQVSLPESYIYRNGQVIEYEYMENHIYFANNYFVVGDTIMPINKDYQLIFDKFILDLKERRILNPFHEIDALPSTLNKMMRGRRLKVQRKSKSNWRLLADERVLIEVENDRLVWLNLGGEKRLSSCFLAYPNKVRTILAPALTHLARNSIRGCQNLHTIIAPNLIEMEERCIESKEAIPTIVMPKLMRMGDMCFDRTRLTPDIDRRINFPLLQQIGYQCFRGYVLKELYLPSCENMGNVFGTYQKTDIAYVPELKKMPIYSSVSSFVPNLYAPKLVSLAKKELINLSKKIHQHQHI